MRENITLDGNWEFELDEDGKGLEEKWFQANKKKFKAKIKVPGAWQAQGFGKTQDHLYHNYVGWGWYRRIVNIPDEWMRDRIWLVIGGVAETTKAFVNGKDAGNHYGFSTPFRFDITKSVHSGQNEIVLAVSNLPKSKRILPPGKHHYNDPTGCFSYFARWGGIYRSVFLESTASTWIQDCYVIPHPLEERIEVKFQIGGEKTNGRVQVDVEGTVEEISLGNNGTGTLSVSLPNPRLWSPEDPALYDAFIRLLDEKGNKIDECRVSFGMREISVKGSHILLNGQPYYFNGYGDDCVEVLSGFPPTDKEIYRERLLMMKACGFNAVRHHSWVPTQEYFEVADEVGMLIQAELPAVYAEYFLPNLHFFQQELINVLKTHRNHPSFFAIAMGNEFYGSMRNYLSRGIDFDRGIEKLYHLAKQNFQTGLVMSNSGARLYPSDIDIIPVGTVSPLDKPVIAHEMGGYGCSLPDIYSREKFTGAVRPTWLETKLEWVLKSGWKGLYHDILKNSQKLLQLRRKFGMENARMQSNCSGYYWWLAADFPAGAEGDAWYQGIVDFFWKPKGFNPDEMCQFNNRTVLFTDVPMASMNIWDDAGLRVDVMLSHYAGNDLEKGHLMWSVTGSDGSKLDSGTVDNVFQSTGSVQLIKQIDVGKYGISSPQDIVLSARLEWPRGETYNSWTFCLFPRPSGPLSDPMMVRSHPDMKIKGIHEIYPALTTNEISAGTKVIICDGNALSEHKFDSQIKGFLESGGSIVFLAQNAGLSKQAPLGFWQDWGVGYGSFIHTHSALSRFPRREFCDQLYFRFFGEGTELLLEDMPQDFVPIAGGLRQRKPSDISTEKRLEKFGMLLEGTLGKGKILMTTWNIITMEKAEARYLVESLVAYALSNEFNPKYDLGPIFEK